MIGPLGGAGFQGGMNLTININAGGPAGGLSPLGGASPLGLGGGGCPCCDGFSPSSELLGGGSPFGGLSPFGGGGMADFAALLGGGSNGLGTPHPGFNVQDTAHPWANGIGGPGLPLDLLSGGGGLPPLGGGSLADQALMMQAAASDMNQASLIGAQTGAMGGLMGAQGTALAGINPLMSGLMSNYM